jgi:hypothetical protein
MFSSVKRKESKDRSFHCELAIRLKRKPFRLQYLQRMRQAMCASGCRIHSERFPDMLHSLDLDCTVSKSLASFTTQTIRDIKNQTAASNPLSRALSSCIPKPKPKLNENGLLSTDLENLRERMGVAGGSAISADDGNGRPAHLCGVVGCGGGQLVVVVSRGCQRVRLGVQKLWLGVWLPRLRARFTSGHVKLGLPVSST